MRHAVKGRKLGRTTSHREALFRNQLQSLMDKERIITTLPKAKELRPLAERVITRGKQGTVHARRWALRWLLRRDLVKKLFDDIAPRFSERPGGYLRIVKLGPRLGDGAEMAVIEMVDFVAPAAADKAAGKDAAAAGGKGGKGTAKGAKASSAKKGAAKPQKAAKGSEDEAAAEEKPKKAAKAAKAPKPKAAKPEGHKGAPPPAHGEGGKGGGGAKRPSGQRPGGRKPTTPQKTG
ncbi:MAG TPA: 50S ribosomal protein L17 [Thermoanaerobaculia bacterium]|nr:50S ribosomal protein L17 [Thermoanaerobaculia bacterium]